MSSFFGILKLFAAMIATTIGCALLEYAFVSRVRLQYFWLIVPFAFLLLAAFLVDVQRRQNHFSVDEQVRQLPFSEMYETLWLRPSLNRDPQADERLRRLGGRASR